MNSEYVCLFKLLLIEDSGGGKSCVLLRKIIVSSAGQSKFLRISLVDKVLSVGHWWTRTFPNNHQQLLRWSTRHYTSGKEKLEVVGCTISPHQYTLVS
ncbi:ras-related protein Rab-1B-like isoform X4 [Papaver somniferum]|uniref:ras-related protein Rab-1B-like isoform X4 n=1 Tax=Papaver somniferum TaxID=3469 RepID=UPI000E6F6DB5|nr:ras-related protein Rab-1B-like isoform X4 [Papaver somniferum]